MFFHYSFKKILLISAYCLAITHTVQAEIWLSDSLYLSNSQQLQFTAADDKSPILGILPEFSLVQGIPPELLASSKITLSSQFDLQTSESKSYTKGIINEFNLTFSANPFWSFTFGRQKISHAQADLFSASLNKNDQSFYPLTELNYSQGILTTYRLGFVEQQLMLIQQTEAEYLTASKSNTPSYHYKIKVGIPGYKVGPLILLISHESKTKENSSASVGLVRAMLGSAVQLPLKFVSGDGQWAFQYARELNNKIEGNQYAWQTSMSWLGFIPRHNLGLLFSHSDKQWRYSDDFTPGQNTTELRYQWLAQQDFKIELAARKTIDKLTSSNSANIKSVDEMNMRLYFSF